MKTITITLNVRTRISHLTNNNEVGDLCMFPYGIDISFIENCDFPKVTVCFTLPKNTPRNIIAGLPTADWMFVDRHLDIQERIVASSLYLGKGLRIPAEWITYYAAKKGDILQVEVEIMPDGSFYIIKSTGNQELCIVYDPTDIPGMHILPENATYDEIVADIRNKLTPFWNLLALMKDRHIKVPAIACFDVNAANKAQKLILDNLERIRTTTNKING